MRSASLVTVNCLLPSICFPLSARTLSLTAIVYFCPGLRLSSGSNARYREPYQRNTPFTAGLIERYGDSLSGLLRAPIAFTGSENTTYKDGEVTAAGILPFGPQSATVSAPLCGRSMAPACGSAAIPLALAV